MNNKTLKLWVVVCFLAVQTSLNAQKEHNSRIGLTVSSLGVGSIIGESSSTNYDLEDKSFYTAGLTYIKGLNKWLDVEAGVEYSNHNIGITPNFWNGAENVYMRIQKVKLQLFNIPVMLKANFLKYFFVNGGLLVDIDITNSDYIKNQTGIGGIVGLGASYDFDFGLSVFLNPYIKAHSWIDISEREKILEKGFRLGITCDLHRIIKQK
jgi:hypothetical protein